MSLTKYSRAEGKKQTKLAKAALRNGGAAISEQAEIIHEGGKADAQITAIKGRWMHVIILGGGSPLSLLDFAPWRIGPREREPTNNCVAKVRKWVRSTFAPPEDGIWVQLDVAGHSGPRAKLAGQYIFLGYAPTQKAPRLTEDKNAKVVVE